MTDRQRSVEEAYIRCMTAMSSRPHIVSANKKEFSACRSGLHPGAGVHAWSLDLADRSPIAITLERMMSLFGRLASWQQQEKTSHKTSILAEELADFITQQAGGV